MCVERRSGRRGCLKTANFSLAREQASRCPRKSEPGLEIGVELSGRACSRTRCHGSRRDRGSAMGGRYVEVVLHSRAQPTWAWRAEPTTASPDAGSNRLGHRNGDGLDQESSSPLLTKSAWPQQGAASDHGSCAGSSSGKQHPKGNDAPAATSRNLGSRVFTRVKWERSERLVLWPSREMARRTG